MYVKVIVDTLNNEETWDNEAFEPAQGGTSNVERLRPSAGC